VETAEVIDESYPEFVQVLGSLGAHISTTQGAKISATQGVNTSAT
jgi:hypothetical protein